MAKFRGTEINPKNFHRSQIKYYVVLILMAIFMMLPIVYIFNHAFKPLEELFAWPPKFFVSNPTWKNFSELFKLSSASGIPASRYLFNSVIITLVVVVTSIVVGSMAGFALSKLKFKLKKPLLFANNIALMFVGTAVVIPKYLIIEKLKKIHFKK